MLYGGSDKALSLSLIASKFSNFVRMRLYVRLCIWRSNGCIGAQLAIWYFLDLFEVETNRQLFHGNNEHYMRRDLLAT